MMPRASQSPLRAVCGLTNRISSTARNLHHDRRTKQAGPQASGRSGSGVLPDPKPPHVEPTEEADDGILQSSIRGDGRDPLQTTVSEQSGLPA